MSGVKALELTQQSKQNEFISNLFADIKLAKQLYNVTRYAEALDILDQVRDDFGLYHLELTPDMQTAYREVTQLFEQCKRALECAYHRNIQIRINTLMPNFLSLVYSFEIEKAIQVLIQIKNYCDEILVPQDVNDLGYIHPDVMRNDLQYLTKWQADYSWRKKNGAKAFAENIAAEFHSTIDPSAQTFLEQCINDAAHANWKDLDQRDLSSLRTALVKYISTILKANNILLITLCCAKQCYIPPQEQNAIKMRILDIVVNNIPNITLEPLSLQMFGPTQPVFLQCANPAVRFSSGMSLALTVDSTDIQSQNTLQSSAGQLKLALS